MRNSGLESRSSSVSSMSSWRGKRHWNGSALSNVEVTVDFSSSTGIADSASVCVGEGLSRYGRVQPRFGQTLDTGMRFTLRLPQTRLAFGGIEPSLA